MALFVVATPVRLSGAEPKRSDFLSQLLDEGVAFERNGNYKDALNRFNTMLVVDPNNAEAHYRIGLLYVTKNEPQKALKYMKKATELAPKNIRLSINLAQQLERYEMLDYAIAEYQRIIATGVRDPRIKEAEKFLALASSQSLVKKDEMNAALLVLNGLMLEYPEDPGVLFGVGGVYVLLNRVDEAERVMKQLESKQPDNDLVHMNLGSLYERTNNVTAALQQYKKIIDHNQSPQAVRLATLRYGMIEGKEYYRLGKWQEAMASFDKLVQLDPKFGEAIFHRALIFLQLKQPLEAEKIFKRLVEMNKNDFSTRLNLASLYGSEMQLDLALAQYQYVIKNDQEGHYRQQAQMRVAVIHNELGNEAFKKGDLERAFQEYSVATQNYGGFALPWFNRGMILLRQNKKQEAIQEFVQAVGVDPAYMQAHIQLVDIYESLGRYTDAANSYDAIMRINPDSNEGKFSAQKLPITKARGLWADKKYAEAQEEFDRILAEQPSNYEAWFYLGAMSDDRGRLIEAADYMQKAVALRPNIASIRLHLANIYQRLEMEELAEDEYRRVLFIGVSNEQTTEVMERLNNVEAALSGFSRRMVYTMGYDSNASLNDLVPSSEVSGALAFGVTYANKFADDLRFNIQFNPSYYTFHKQNFDFWRFSMLYGMIKGNVDRSWSLNYGADSIVDIDTSNATSTSGAITIRNSRRLFLPAAFGLAPEGMEGEEQPTAVDLYLGVRDAESSGSQPLLSITPNFGVSAAQSLVGGISASVSYSVATSRNKVHTEGYQQRDTSRLDPFSGRIVPGNDNIIDKVFDSRDYELDSHIISLSLQRMLRPGLRGSVSTNAVYINYINPDSVVENKRRQNIALGLAVSFTYMVQKDLNVFGALDWQKMRSNLPVRGVVRDEVRPFAENLQSTGLGGYAKFTMTFGMQMAF
ncbi:MAG: tetratricopeptide repeat protein [Pseudomonadota bacterium]